MAMTADRGHARASTARGFMQEFLVETKNDQAGPRVNTLVVVSGMGEAVPSLGLREARDPEWKRISHRLVGCHFRKREVASGTCCR